MRTNTQTEGTKHRTHRLTMSVWVMIASSTLL